MTKEDTIEDVIIDVCRNQYNNEYELSKNITKAIKQHYLGKLPKEKIPCAVSGGVRIYADCDTGYNQALADVRKVIGGEDERD